MDDRNDRRRERLSWSEIDKLRDKSRNRDRDPMQKQSSPVALAAQKSYRAALERAFANGKLGELAKTLAKPVENTRPAGPASPPPAAPVPPPSSAPLAEAIPIPAPLPAPQKDPDREHRQKLLQKIRDAESREAVSRAIDAFLLKYPKLPDDFELLTKCLGHRNDERVMACLEQLSTLIERDKPRRARTLAARLRMLEDTHGDPEVRALAGRVRARL